MISGRIVLLVQPVLAALIVVAVVTVTDAVRGSVRANCIKDTTVVRLSADKPVYLRDYLCQAGEANRPQVRVQFHRLNDIAIGALLLDAAPEHQERIFGRGRFVRNAVIEELVTLIGKFARAVVLPQNVGMELTGGSDTEVKSEWVPTGETKGRRVPELAGTFSGWVNFPQPKALLQLQQKQGLPPGYTQHSKSVYWRYLGRSDFETFDEKVAEYNRLISEELRDHFGFRAEYMRANRRDIELPLHLGKRNWPEEFIVMIAEQVVYEGEGCEAVGGWTVAFRHRDFLVDVVTIENVTRKTITIDGIMGAEETGTGLRRLAESRSLQGRRAKSLTWEPQKLEPGEKLVVLVRINLPFPEDLKSKYLSGPGPKPAFIDFVYGPEVVIKGIEVDGRPIVFDKRTANLLALTASIVANSCPYVYYWDEASGRWITHGKVIEKSKGANAEASETVTLDGLVTKFRIAEEESELALINQAGLVLELDTGQKLTLPPAQDELLAKDQSYIPILFGQALPVEFDTPPLPDGVQVVRSHFTVTGYYRRYSDIIAQHYQPERPSVLPQLEDLSR